MDIPSGGRAVGPSRSPILAIILVSYLMIVLDISIVITGLPKIREDLALSATSLSWVQNAYTLAFGGLLLLGARAGDMLGRKRMFLTGLSLFTASSLAIGLAPSAAVLLSARALQGIGAAILAPSTLALISTNFQEGAERTRALSWYAAVAGVAASLGLVLGGLFAGALSWRVGFFLNVPIGIALVLAGRKVLTETPRVSGQFDLLGAFTSTIGMTALVFGVVQTAEAGWNDRLALSAIGTGLVLIAAFLALEARARQPILPLRLFASRQRVGAYGARLLFLGGMVGFWFFTTQFMQLVMGMTPFQAGLAFLPTTLPNFAAAMLAPRLIRRFGNAHVLAGALVISIIGLAWLGRASAESSYLWALALPMVLIGAGQGLAMAPLTVAGVAGVEPRDAGAASGLVNVAHQLGGSLGLAILIVVFAAAAPPLATGRDVLAHRIDAAITGGAALLVIALVLVLSLVVPSQKGGPRSAA